MAIAPVNKFLNIAVPVAPGVQKLYEVPTGTSSLLLYAQVSNVAIGDTYPTVTFFQRREQRSTGNTRDVRVIKEAEIPPNDALILVDGRIVLEKTPLVVDSVYLQGTQVGVTTISNVVYDEPTGIATVTTMADHGFSATEKITLAGIYFDCGYKATPGNATTYDPTTGLLVLDIGAHPLKVGQSVKIADDAMQFTCTHGSGNKSYPRSTDPASGKSLIIQAITPTTITVQVLETIPSTNQTTHSFVNGSGVADSVANTYTGITTNIFPDPQQSYIVDTVPTSTSFSVEVGRSSGNIHNYQPAVHKFVRARPETVEVVDGSGSGHANGTKFPCWNAEYNPTSGELVLDIGPNTLTNSNTVKILDDTMFFTCSMDNHYSEHSYPRESDPAGDGTTLPMAVASSNKSIRVNVGSTNAGGYVAPLQMEFIASVLENSNV